MIMTCFLALSLSHYLVGGVPTPLKKYEFVSWDDDIPIYIYIMESHKSHAPNHQPVEVIPYFFGGSEGFVSHHGFSKIPKRSSRIQTTYQ